MNSQKRKAVTKFLPYIIAFVIIAVMIMAFVPMKTVIVEASCEEDGAVYKCSLFGIRYKTESIGALGHEHGTLSYVKEPTCTEYGTTTVSKCSRCGEVLEEEATVSPLGHDFKNGRCTRCGLTYTEPVEAVGISLNGNSTNKFNYKLFSGNISTVLSINGETYNEAQSPFGVSFEFEEDINAKVENGELYIDDVVGTVHLSVTIQGSNVVTENVVINVECPENAKLMSIETQRVSATGRKYTEGELFNPKDIRVSGIYSMDMETKKFRILDFKYEDITLDPSVSEIEITYCDKKVAYPITVSPKMLEKIEIDTYASTTEYNEGQKFNADGLIIKAYYENNKEPLLVPYDKDHLDYYFIKTETYLKETDTSVRIYFTDNGVTKYVDHPIKVNPKILLNLTVDDTDVRKYYTAGDCFDPDGLIVTAEFKYIGEQIITDYSYDKTALSCETTDVIISYTVGDVTFEKSICVTVDRQPYQKLCRIKVATPGAVNISWIYNYKKDGESVSDNTNWKEYSLLYDKTNGEYDVPVGAIVTVTVINPAIIDIEINGKSGNMNYEEKSVSRKIKNCDGINITLTETTVSQSLIRFTGDGKNQYFLYDGAWDGYLTEENLGRLNAVYNDNENSYHLYLIDGEFLRYEDLSTKRFEKNSVINVTKNSKAEDAKRVILHLSGTISYTVRIPKDELDDWIIPLFSKAGYEYKGLAREENGEVLSREEIINLLRLNEEIDLYIVWKKNEEETVDYSNKYIHKGEDGATITDNKTDDGDIAVCGEWYLNCTDDDNSVTCEVVVILNGNGTFGYSFTYNGKLNCKYFGKYRINGNCIEIISSEPSIDGIPYLNGSDFGISIEKNDLQCNLILIDNEIISFETCQLAHR